MSGERTGRDYDLTVVIGEAGDESGVEHARLIVELTDAVIAGDPARLAAARAAVVAAMGPAALADAVGVAALQNAKDRVADATGIPIETDRAAATVDMRARLGIDRFGAGRDPVDGD